MSNPLSGRLSAPLSRLVAPLLVLAAGVAAAQSAPPPGEVKREVRIITLDGNGQRTEREMTLDTPHGDLRLEGLPALAMGGNRAVLGVMPAAADQEPGVGILEVTPESGAAKAGLKPGDRILTVAGKAVASPEALLASMDGVKPGTPLQVDILRDGKKQTVEVTPQERQARVMMIRRQHGGAPEGMPGVFMGEGPAMGHGMHRGMPRGMHRGMGPELATLSPALGKYFGTEKGVLVVAARDQLKLQDGDVLQSIGGRAVTDKAQARRILRSYAPGEAVPLVVLRDRKKVALEAIMPARRHVDVTLDEAGGHGEKRVRVKVMERASAP